MPERTETKLTPAPSPQSGPTIIVEDGSIVPNANSYIDVAFADTYHLGTVYADEWNNATADLKAKAVVNATRAIDMSVDFNGYLVDQNQPLRWPRVYCPNPEIYTGYPYGGYPISMGNIAWGYFPSNEIPEILKEATAQEALEILRVDRLADAPALGIQSMRVADIDLVYRSGSGAQSGGVYLPLSQFVGSMLAPLGTVTSGGGFSIIKGERVM